jgi:hypothetical protein
LIIVPPFDWICFRLLSELEVMRSFGALNRGLMCAQHPVGFPLLMVSVKLKAPLRRQR